MAYNPVFQLPAIPTYTVPNRPTLPPGLAFPDQYAGQESVLKDRLTKLPALFAPRRKSARSSLEAALAGIGGYRFRQDDPATAQDESLMLDFDAEGQLGERQRDTVHGARNAMNARGMLYSSFTDEAVGKGLGDIARYAQDQVRGYEGSLGQIANDEGNAVYGGITDLANLYGDAGKWAIENAPPPPPPPVAAQPAAAQPIGPMIGDQWTSTAPGPRTPEVSYAEFVRTHGGKSTAALADLWKRRFAPWLLTPTPIGGKFKVL